MPFLLQNRLLCLKVSSYDAYVKFWWILSSIFRLVLGSTPFIDRKVWHPVSGVVRRRYLLAPQPPGGRPDPGPLRQVPEVRVHHAGWSKLAPSGSAIAGHKCGCGCGCGAPATAGQSVRGHELDGKEHDVATHVAGQEEREGGVGQAQETHERVHVVRQEIQVGVDSATPRER